eukprot:TRINITY_DN93508_c0_g1_i1.p1 TRINITY_DN93508_c0_g1~~TRINITY_DN93508_c0_g1_i1.p1  ORF type:complete len:609 (+),score=128.74 TRINITY_DN93508_c0_g1_i1:85-1911(+)
MDTGDVALAIRRARRSGAKSIDLSNRGLRAWPEDLFGLTSLRSIDISGNALTSVEGGINNLEQLEELNVAGNKLERLPDMNLTALQNFRSLMIGGNPVAASLSPSVIRQLSQPPYTPGQSPNQVIQNLLASAGGGPRPPPSGPPAASEISPISAADGCGPAPPPGPPPPGNGLDVDRALMDSDSGSAWRKQQASYLKEIERLQARVSELESKPGSAGGGGTPSSAGGSDASLPAWLQQSRGAASLSQTLPSRQGAFDSDQVTDLKNQLKEEQRKTKRLEGSVQKLELRMSERSMGSSGGVGTLPHFEMAEVELGEILNQGGFSVVHQGVFHSTKVAVKKLFDPNISEELLAEFDNEVQKLEQIRHPNILMVLAVHRKPPALSLICELVEGGSFYQLLHSPFKFRAAPQLGLEKVTEKESLEILDVAGVAIAFLHGRGVAHRDIKTQNVLLSPYLEVKLCDFGLARMRSELMTGSMQFAGTPNYMAPEIFANQKYTELVDVWAFGTMLWEAMEVDIPYANLDPADIRDKVVSGRLLPMPKMASHAIQGVIQACWTHDQGQRPTMAEALSQLRHAAGGGSAARSRRPRTAGATPNMSRAGTGMGTSFGGY